MKLHMNLLRRSLLAVALLPTAVLAEPQIRPLALETAADYLQLARYPQWSSVLEPGAIDPVLDSRVPTRQSRLGPDGAFPRLTVWNATMTALPGDTVTLYASLTNDGQGLIEALPTALSAVRGATVTGELIGRELGGLGSIVYRDDGAAPDAIANDGVYTGRFTLPAGQAPALGMADSVLIKVAAVLANTDVRRAAGGLLYSNPAARLTGRFTDSIRNGNLVIAAELDVLAPGRVHLAGTLADALGAPFATGQAARSLQPGKQWLELSFYGLAFHDRAIAGAVQLASLSLTSVNGMPNALGPLVTNAHTTNALNLLQLTRLPFNDPDLLEQARRLQADVLGKVTAPLQTLQ